MAVWIGGAKQQSEESVEEEDISVVMRYKTQRNQNGTLIICSLFKKHYRPTAAVALHLARYFTAPITIGSVFGLLALTAASASICGVWMHAPTLFCYGPHILHLLC